MASPRSLSWVAADLGPKSRPSELGSFNYLTPLLKVVGFRLWMLAVAQLGPWGTAFPKNTNLETWLVAFFFFTLSS